MSINAYIIALLVTIKTYLYTKKEREIIIMQQTLNTFINSQLTKYGLPCTEKNQKKLRRKFTSLLKEMKAWDSAKTTTLGRNRTKLFNAKVLQKLEITSKPYMEKQAFINSPIPKNELNKIITKELQKENINKINIAQDLADLEKENIDNKKNEKLAVKSLFKQTQDTLTPEINQIMLEAIFNKLFKPKSDWKKQFTSDYNTINSLDIKHSDPRYLNAQYRLTHPKNNYYEDR
jgi:hypothetical protein